MQAPVRQFLRVPVTPKIADLIFTQVEDCSRKVFPAYGTAHPNTTVYPNHKLVLIRPNNAQGASDESFLFTYAADRASQDDYNFEHVQADYGGDKYDLVRRTYVTPRADYNPATPANGAAMSTSPSGKFPAGYVLAGRQETRIGDEALDSLYVTEVRTYIYRASLSESDFNPSSGVSRATTSNLYYRGETIDGTPIETLTADPDNAYWDGSGDVRYRTWQQLSEDWFLVNEIEIGLTDDPKVSRVWDGQGNLFVDVTQTPVEPGTNVGTLVGDTITETNAGDYLQSQQEVRNPDMASAVTVTDQKLTDGAVVASIASTAVVKGSVSGSSSGGVRVEVEGGPQYDIRKVTSLPLPGPWLNDDRYDHDLKAFVQVRKRWIERGTQTGGVSGNIVTEIQNYDDLVDFQIESEIDNSVIGRETTMPAVFNYQFPAVLTGIRVVGCFAWASNGNSSAFDRDYYIESNIVQSSVRSVSGRIIRFFTNEAGLSDIMDSYPTFDWGETAVNFGIVNAMAIAGDSGVHADATAAQVGVQPTIHGALTVDVSSVGRGVLPDSDSPSRVVSISATPNWGSYPDWITIDVDKIDHRYGVYEVQVKQIASSAFTIPSGTTFAPALGTPH
jgi:hypothetical protein